MATKTLAEWCEEKRREVERLCSEAVGRCICANLHNARCAEILRGTP